MKTSALAGSLVAAFALLATPLNAQELRGEVAVQTGPVSGRVIVADGSRTSYVKRYAPRVIVVEKVRHDGRRWKRDWRRQGYRRVVVYYIDGRYFDRIHRRHPRVREIVVYERNGRYYNED